MPVNEQKDQEAWEVSDMIRSAGNIVETALRAEDEASRKALRDAAKTILQRRSTDWMKASARPMQTRTMSKAP